MWQLSLTRGNQAARLEPRRWYNIATTVFSRKNCGRKSQWNAYLSSIKRTESHLKYSIQHIYHGFLERHVSHQKLKSSAKHLLHKDINYLPSTIFIQTWNHLPSIFSIICLKLRTASGSSTWEIENQFRWYLEQSGTWCPLCSWL